MMNYIKVFEHIEFGKIRTMEYEGEVWFVGKGAGESLGFEGKQEKTT